MRNIIILSILLFLYTFCLFTFWTLNTTNIKTWLALFLWEFLAQALIETYFKYKKEK